MKGDVDTLARLFERYRAGDGAGAAECARRLLDGDPEQADALHILALLAMARNDRREGMELMRRSVAGPGADNPAYVANMARAVARLGEAAEAEPWLRRALVREPDAQDLLFALGDALMTLRRTDEAEPLMRRLVELDPGHLGAATRLGLITQDRDLDEARRWFERAVRLDPKVSTSWFNLGNTLLDLHRPNEAEGMFRRALAIDPGHVPSRVHLAYALLMRNACREGFREYLARWNGTPPVPLRFVGRPAGAPWTGQPLDGRTILLFAEQGFGDALQFIRFAVPLAERGARVLLTGHPELSGLMAHARGVAAVIEPGDQDRHAIDVHAALMDLPHRLDVTADTIPADVPYLAAPPERAAEWRDRLGPFGGPTVALAWRSHPRQPTSPWKSCPLAALEPVLAVRGVRFISLQRPLDPRDPPLPRHVIHLGGELRDFADTAGILANVDLVISVDTALAHLAGAMARPLWLPLCAACDWRWGLSGEASPWYPTARLFRQKTPGDWAEVAARLAAALAERLARPPGP